SPSSSSSSPQRLRSIPPPPPPSLQKKQQFDPTGIALGKEDYAHPLDYSHEDSANAGVTAMLSKEDREQVVVTAKTYRAIRRVVCSMMRGTPQTETPVTRSPFP